MSNQTESFENRKSEFLEAANAFSVSALDSYLQSYPSLVRFFEQANFPFDKHTLTQGIHMVYGWMPKVFKFRAGDMGDVLKVLNKGKSEDLSADEITLVKGFLNNSLVGTSKLLHFINPDRYPIWDSHIYYFFFQKAAQANQIGNPELYQTYQETVKKWCEEPACLKVQDTFGQKWYAISKLRACEMVLFYAARNANQKGNLITKSD